MIGLVYDYKVLQQRVSMRRFLTKAFNFIDRFRFPKDAYFDKKYPAWFENQRTKEPELAIQRRHKFSNNPKLSLVVPLYKTPLNFLADMTSSVLNQTYTNFELVLVNASPEIEELQEALKELCVKDSRIKTITLEDNFGIVGNTNIGIDNATGDFVSFLDHDDYLEPDALYHFVDAINKNSEIDLLFCDEDMVGEDGIYLQPILKPGYSPDVLLCKNYVVHLLTVRKTLLDTMPRPGKEVDGAQDYNVTFFAAENARAIHHVPRVLYHWRISATSTATNAKLDTTEEQSKPYAEEAGRHTIEKHLERTGQTGTVAFTDIKYVYNTKIDIAPKTTVSVVVDVGDKIESVDALIGSFNAYVNYPFIHLVFVASKEFNPRVAPVHTWETAVVDKGASQTLRLNFGAKKATGDFILFLQGDMVFDSKSLLEDLLSAAHRKGIGAVSAKIAYADGFLKYCGFALPKKSILPLYHGVPHLHPGYLCLLSCRENFSAVPVMGMMVRKAIFDQVGGFNEEYRSMVRDIDFCTKLIEAGYFLSQPTGAEVVIPDYCPLLRYSNKLNAQDFDEVEVRDFANKNPELWVRSDPYFNTNHKQSSGYFQL